MSLVIGVDVGGTFTDLFVLDEAAQRVSVVKVPSTRGEEARGFLAGVRRAVEHLGDVSTIVHGTTVGTNALLERRVARTGIITTRGFRDVLEMRRRDRPRTWGLTGGFEPIVPRDLRLEVDERTLADGMVLQPVDPEQVLQAARALLAAGCEAACVFFVNAHANPENERAAVEALRAAWPNAHVTASHEVLPEIREFERCSTATLNACLQPVVGEYLARLERDLAADGCTADLLIVQSNGGVMSRATASDFPVRTALSGPAAGVIACARIGEAAGFPDLITGDMGGTSFDVSLVAGGRAALAAQTAIDFGMVVRTPMIQIETIGAGGGSIASVDAGGLLRVGPGSAGSVPGPACYGRGGTRPTVTDANVLLGRIDARRPIGGGLLPALDVERARAAIAEHVGEPLGLAPLAAAEAILTVANAKMAGAIRLVSIERGHDPRRFAYMPFGGGGALHACAMMREVGVATSLVPRHPGVTSALGCVIADLRHDAVRTINRALADLEGGQIAEEVDALAATCRARIAGARMQLSDTRERIELDMLYAGQTHTVAVPVTRAQLERGALAAAFADAYRAAFGRTLDGLPVRVMNLRYALIGLRPAVDLALLAPADGPMPAPREHRPVYHAGAWHEVPVFERLSLPPAARIAGPAVLDQPDTTIWLEPGFEARVDELGNLVIARLAS